MDALLAETVRKRALGSCEYCRLPAAGSCIPFEIDHIIAKKHGGATVTENLALSCIYCNIHKGPNIAGKVPETGAITRLYNPRADRWEEHFKWAGPVLVGTSDVGRTTIAVLNTNAADFIPLRTSLMREGIFLAIGPTSSD